MMSSFSVGQKVCSIKATAAYGTSFEISSITDEGLYAANGSTFLNFDDVVDAEDFRQISAICKTCGRVLLRCVNDERSIDEDCDTYDCDNSVCAFCQPEQVRCLACFKCLFCKDCLEFGDCDVCQRSMCRACLWDGDMGRHAEQRGKMICYDCLPTWDPENDSQD